VQLSSQIRELRDSRDGFEKQFRETSDALTSLEKSQKLTQEALEKKKAELAEAMGARANTEKILASTKAALKDSRQEVNKLVTELELVQKNYHISKRNCEKLKEAFENATTAVKIATTVLEKSHYCP